MSCVEYNVVELEVASGYEVGKQSSKPFAVPDRAVNLGEQVTRRVAEVLDFQLSQGSMPA